MEVYFLDFKAMNKNDFRECLSCGMTVAVSNFDYKEKHSAQYCPKCDSDLFSQTDGSCLTKDIAHQHETVSQAMDKMHELLNQAYAGCFEKLRLVVGNGLIKDEVLGQLYFLKEKGHILSYVEADKNYGAIIVRIRQSKLK
jgi:predicted RNA-binding Zn-ribbon protein involved in translation (DUF1610 family)